MSLALAGGRVLQRRQLQLRPQRLREPDPTRVAPAQVRADDRQHAVGLGGCQQPRPRHRVLGGEPLDGLAMRLEEGLARAEQQDPIARRHGGAPEAASSRRVSTASRRSVPVSSR